MNIAFWTFLLTAVAFGPANTNTADSSIDTPCTHVASSTVANAIRFAR